MAFERVVDARGPVHQFATAIGAAIVERLGALRTKSAFERADERAGFIGGQVGAAAFAIRAHFEHRAALARWKPRVTLGRRDTVLLRRQELRVKGTSLESQGSCLRRSTSYGGRD